MPLKPRQPAPALDVKTLDGGAFRLGDAKPRNFSMIVVYRGLHCPVCKNYLGELQAKLPEFTRRGVEVLAVSADTRDRAAKSKADWGLETLAIGYELPLATARDWELFVSTAVREGEPAQFTEPGLFLVKPDGTLFYAAVNNAPWGRPPLDQVLRGIDMAIERKALARGEA
jgi:peroxiredoxin